jgi:hypothetical protein
MELNYMNFIQNEYLNMNYLHTLFYFFLSGVFISSAIQSTSSRLITEPIRCITMLIFLFGCFELDVLIKTDYYSEAFYYYTGFTSLLINSLF